jgi:diacylglycerol kinase family enzyme
VEPVTVVANPAAGGERGSRLIPYLDEALTRLGIAHRAGVELAADRPFQAYADGERLGSLPASFTVEPGALEVVAP